MTDVRLLALIDDLRALPAETAWLEFKENNTDPRVIGRLISAVSNAARLEDKDFGYVVFVVYAGDGRAATVMHRKDFPLGYASGFTGFNTHVNTLIPSPEGGEAAVREARPLFPPVAVRELTANALIHQDMMVTGAGPTVPPRSGYVPFRA